MHSSTGLAITAWSAVSAFGVGREALTIGLRGAHKPVVSLDPTVWPAAVKEACLVPDFEPRELLGRRGTRAMDRATSLAVVAIGCLLDDHGERLPGVGEDAGLVLGTSTGSIASIMSFTRDSLTQEKPYFVDPERFPNTVMNRAAGQSAIWHRLRGPNVTIAGGRASALHALNYGWRLHRAGRARAVIFGAVEEFSAERSWLERHSRCDGDMKATMGEGCAVMLLECPPAGGRKALAEVRAVELGVAHSLERTEAILGLCVRRALEKAECSPEHISTVIHCGALPNVESRVLAQTLGRSPPVSFACDELLGDTQAASAAFQLVAALVLAERTPDCPGHAALVTSVDRDGMVGCALLHLPSRGEA